VVTRADPLADIRTLMDTANIALVLKDGAVVKDTLGAEAEV
jgi:imidazolonepropionase-like amidohydrolase